MAGTTASAGTEAIIETPAKSFVGCHGRFFDRLGLTVWFSVASSHVYPSGALLATCSVPMEAFAPGFASSTIGEPQFCAMRSTTGRPMISTMPPGGHGTMKRTGLDG